MADTIQIDCSTGTIAQRPLSAGEVTALAALQDTASAAQAVEHAQITERAAASDDVRQAATAALTRLDAIVAAEATMTAAQTRTAVVDVARITRRLVRLLVAQAG
jgi:hypothetical protein